jgi:transposase InsO family protein
VSPHPVAVICRVLGVSRSSAYRAEVPRGPFYRRRDDERVAGQIRVVVKTRATYGHRRVTALVNRLFGTRYNRKRIRRVMQLYGLTLSTVNRRRGRAHTGRIMRDRSNERWCSDELLLPCWNGEVVHVAFALDCHDREVLAHVAAARPLLATDIQELMRRAVAHRFGARRPPEPIQWLSDNGSIYTALATEWEAERLTLQPITTPAYSPESNGMSEALVHTLKRDYVDGADCATAATVLSQLSGWIEDYNEHAPHSALRYRAPRQYRRERTPKGTLMLEA